MNEIYNLLNGKKDIFKILNKQKVAVIKGMMYKFESSVYTIFIMYDFKNTTIELKNGLKIKFSEFSNINNYVKFEIFAADKEILHGNISNLFDDPKMGVESKLLIKENMKNDTKALDELFRKWDILDRLIDIDQTHFIDNFK